MSKVTLAGGGAVRAVTRLRAANAGDGRTGEFTARLVAAGRYVVSARAIRQAVDDGLFRGLACFVDHATGHPSVRDLLGVWHDVVWDEAAQAAVGQLRVFETAATQPVVDLLSQWMAVADRPAVADRAAGDGRPDLGISLVFYPALAGDGTTIDDLVMIESADVVMFPAVESARLVGGKELAHAKARRGEEEGERGLVLGPERARLVGGGINARAQRGKDAKVLQKLRVDSRSHLVTVVEDGHMGHEDMENEMLKDNGQVVVGGNGLGKTAEWHVALRAAATEAIVGASGLPGVVQERLRGEVYDDPDAVHAAVDRARAEMAALSATGVVRLGNRPPREIQISDPLDRAREMVGFFFGDSDAAAPPVNMRSFADLYVALTGDVYFRGVFDGTRVAFAGATTSTLPNLAVDAMNKVIVQQFQALDHYRWYERITSVEPNDGSLQDMKWITLGGVGNLPTVNEGAAYTELDVADVAESAAFVKRGGYVGITREMIKNSNIQQLQAIPRALAVAAVRTRSSAVAALFTASSGVGPTLAQDSKALFHADHANLLTTAFGTDATAWRAARAECFQQAEVGSGKPLGIFPRYALVPAELYDTALSVLGYGEGMPATYAPEAQGRGFADPRPVPLVVPEWTDATDWAYIVDPAVFPVIQMSYSQQPGGRQHPAPELFAVVSDTSGLMFANDILPVKVRDEFALGVNGHRGIGKRNVA